jgi:hypothetical protein
MVFERSTTGLPEVCLPEPLTPLGRLGERSRTPWLPASASALTRLPPRNPRLFFLGSDACDGYRERILSDAREGLPL